jgi:hypothetical protein
VRIPPLGGAASVQSSASGSAALGTVDAAESVLSLPQALTALALDDDGHDEEEENEQAHDDHATDVQVVFDDLLACELHVGARVAEGSAEPEGQNGAHGHAGHSRTPGKGEPCSHEKCDQNRSPKRVHRRASTLS